MEFKQYLSKGVNLFRYSSGNEDFIKRKGQIFCFISVVGDNAEKFSNINKKVWDTVIDEYSQAKITRIVESLKNALKKGEKVSRELLKKDSDYKDKGIDLSFTIVIEAEGKVYFGRFGNHGIYAWHNGRYINISSHLDKNRVKVASSMLGNEDVLIIATENYGKKILKKGYSAKYISSIASKDLSGEGIVAFSRQKSLLESDKQEEIKEDKAEKLKASEKSKSPEQSDKKSLLDTPGGIKKVDTIDIGGKSTEIENDDIPIVNDVNQVEIPESEFERETAEDTMNKSADSLNQGERPYGDSKASDETIVDEKLTASDSVSSDSSDATSVPQSDGNQPKSQSDGNQLKSRTGKQPKSQPEKQANAGAKGLFGRLAARLANFSGKKSRKTTPSEGIQDSKRYSKKKRLGHDSQISIDEIAERQKEISERKEADNTNIQHEQSKTTAAQSSNSAAVANSDPSQKNTLDKAKSSIKGAVTFFDKIISFIGTVFQKIGAVIMAIIHFLMGVAGQKYGRQPWYKKWSAKLSQAKIKLGSSPTNIKVVGYQEAERRKKIVGTMVLGLILIILFIYGYRFAQTKKQERELHLSVIEDIDKAQSLVDEADRLARSDPATAQSKLDQADNLVMNAVSRAQRDEDRNLAQNVENDMVKVDDEINLRSSLSEADENIAVYMDGKLRFGDQSNPTDISIAQLNVTNEYLFVGDSGESAVYRISLSNDTIIRIPDVLELVTDPKYVSAGIGGVFVYDTGEGVISSMFDNENKNQDFSRVDGTGLDASSLEEKEISALSILTYFDKIYLLSQNDEAILKTEKRTAGNYALPWKFLEEEYLGQGTDIFADDEYVYTTSKNEGIKRYASQAGFLVESPISVEGLNKPLEDVTCGFASSLNENVYVFDAASNRVVAFDRLAEEGKLIMDRQYVYRGDTNGAFTDVKDLVVDQDDEYMYLLDGVRIWRIEL